VGRGREARKGEGGGRILRREGGGREGGREDIGLKKV